jgi:hypothetical protein
MFRFDAATMICLLRDKLCPASWGLNDKGELPGIVFAVDMDLSVYIKAAERFDSIRKTTFVLLCGNTNVFTLTEDDDENIFNPITTDVARWDNPSNHDSCWRSDGMEWLSKNYFAAAEELNRRNHLNVAPKDMSDHTALGRLKAPWELVWVKHESVDGRSYRRKLVSLRSR